jgi:hypothetical protein
MRGLITRNLRLSLEPLLVMHVEALHHEMRISLFLTGSFSQSDQVPLSVIACLVTLAVSPGCAHERWLGRAYGSPVPLTSPLPLDPSAHAHVQKESFNNQTRQREFGRNPGASTPQ